MIHLDTIKRFKSNIYRIHSIALSPECKTIKQTAILKKDVTQVQPVIDLIICDSNLTVIKD